MFNNSVSGTKFVRNSIIYPVVLLFLFNGSVFQEQSFEKLHHLPCGSASVVQWFCVSGTKFVRNPIIYPVVLLLLFNGSMFQEQSLWGTQSSTLWFCSCCSMVLCFRNKVHEELDHLPCGFASVVQWFCVSGTKFVRNSIIYPVVLFLLFNGSVFQGQSLWGTQSSTRWFCSCCSVVLCFGYKVCEELHHLPCGSAPVVQWFCVSGTKFVRNSIIYPVVLLLMFNGSVFQGQSLWGTRSSTLWFCSCCSVVLCFRYKVCEELHHLPCGSVPVVQWFCVSGTKFVRNFIIYPVVLLLLFSGSVFQGQSLWGTQSSTQWFCSCCSFPSRSASFRANLRSARNSLKTRNDRSTRKHPRRGRGDSMTLRRRSLIGKSLLYSGADTGFSVARGANPTRLIFLGWKTSSSPWIRQLYSLEYP